MRALLGATFTSKQADAMGNTVYYQFRDCDCTDVAGLPVHIRAGRWPAAVASDVTIHVGAHSFPLKAIVIPVAEFVRLKREGKVSAA